MFIFRQLDPGRGIRQLPLLRGRHVTPSTGRFYLYRPLVAFLFVIVCTLLIHGPM